MNFQKEYQNIEKMVGKKQYLASIIKCADIFHVGLMMLLKQYINTLKLQEKQKILREINEKVNNINIDVLSLDELIDLEGSIDLISNMRDIGGMETHRIKTVNLRELAIHKNDILNCTTKIKKLDAEIFLTNLKVFLTECKLLGPYQNFNNWCSICGNYITENSDSCPHCPQPEKKKEEDFEETYFISTLKNKIKCLKKNEKQCWEASFFNDTTMVFIPEGEFLMGCEDQHAYLKESPEHKVYLSPYWISKFEITFKQFDQYCKETGNPRPYDEDWERGVNPVIYVSWFDASNYCQWMSSKTGLTFKLPTEAQWEKASRGSEKRKYPWGDEEPQENLANYEYLINKTTPVNSYPQGISPFGVMDMAGNVWEWCFDWYDEAYYNESPLQNPTGPESGISRVIRGGGWGYDASFLRTSNRNRWKPADYNNVTGFRIVLQL
jgi:formylglycine-generating enzyme required for sulfatase activity